MSSDSEFENGAPAEGTPAVARGLRRWLLLIGGYLALALGAIGVVLPLLPTTPFLILAAYFFARSSPSMHQRLLDNRIFGPLIAEWSEHKAIPASAKALAVTMIIVFGTIAIVLLDRPWARIGLATFLVGVITWLLTRPTSPTDRLRSRHR